MPWAYVKIAEGCDRSCGFCAIPSFRGPQRSRDVASILAEVEQLEAREIVLVAQDLASYGKDRPGEMGAGSIVPLVQAVAAAADRVRLLYLYPSDLSDALIDVICDSGVPYFDLSLQHVSKPLLRRMRRWGDGQRFLDRIADIRDREPDAAFRSNFIVGYPGETEADHDQLLHFVEEAQLDWCGFFSYSREDGTYAADLDGAVDPELMHERLAELRELQDDITATRRDALIGSTIEVLVDTPGVGRSHREAPEIDGIVHVGRDPHRRRTRRRDDRRCARPRSGGRWGGCRLARERGLMVEPDKLATWANAITVGRLLLSPLMFWAIPNDDQGSWISFVLWFVLCASDGIDGYIARRHGTTSAGAFLDPLADKVLILGAMFTLVSTGVFWVVPVIIIAVREFVISIYRVLVGGKGISVPACDGQVQDGVPATRRGFAVLPLTALDATWLWNCLLWIAVVLALVSGAQYLVRARQLAESLHRRRSTRSADDPALRCARGRDRVAPRADHRLELGVDGRRTRREWHRLARPGEGRRQRRPDRSAVAAAARAADAVIMCGGLGPTHDDLTRDAIAVMGVELELDDTVADVIRTMFASRGRTMAENNLRQAMVPVGATVIPQTRGTAPG